MLLPVQQMQQQPPQPPRVSPVRVSKSELSRVVPNRQVPPAGTWTTCAFPQARGWTSLR
jgi:hypothetical protein